MWRQSTSNINNRHFQCARGWLSTGSAWWCTCNIQIVAMYIRIDEHGQISGIDAAFKVLLKHLHHIVVALLWIAAQVMPHQIIDDALSHTLSTQETCIKTLVAPLDPAGLRRNAVDEHQSTDFIRMAVGKSCQYIGAGSNAKANHWFETEMWHHENQLSSQFIHGWIHVAVANGEGENSVWNFNILKCLNFLYKPCKRLHVDECT